jgi:Diphthamide synthase
MDEPNSLQGRVSLALDSLEDGMERVLVSWSGGKDSAMALAETLRSKRYEVAALLTTVTRDYDRISMHGVRRVLLEQQAESLGLKLEEVFITKNASNEEYEMNMARALLKYQDSGITSCGLWGYLPGGVAKIPRGKAELGEHAGPLSDLEKGHE